MKELNRFIAAQNDIWPDALAELHRGRKESHWMWFIFPQLRSLGRSATAKRYGITDLDEARAYLAHPVLGTRLSEAALALLAHRDRSADEILGATDAMKLRSSATLFREAGGGQVFQALLDRFYDGAPCPLTMAELRGGDE